MTTETSDLVKFYFRQCSDNPSYYYCRNDKCQAKSGQPAKAYKQKPGSGWTNLRQHLRACVGADYDKLYQERLEKSGGTISGYFLASPRDTDVYQVIEWIVMRNQPISEIDNYLTRAIFRTKPLSSKSIRKYILSMVPLVEGAVIAELPDRFGLLFDGWSDGSVHFVAIFATYRVEEQYHETLIAFSPLLKEDDMGAAQHLEFIKESLQVYQKSLTNVVAFISDNCAVNQRLSCIASVPLIGCSAHKFNLAVEAWCVESTGLVDALKCIRELMSKLRTLKSAAKLRELTHLGAILPNETRWTGKYQMVKRFFRLETAVSQIEDLDSFLPTPSQRRVLDRALHHLEKFASISHNIQEKGLLLNKARFVFDSIVADYPSMRRYLAKDAAIVQDHQFESAVVKLLNGKEEDLTDLERSAATTCRLATTSHHVEDAQESEEVSHMPYFEQIEAKRRKMNIRAEFIVPDFLPATSCSAERAFSAARWVLTDIRKRMSPILFEAILFLKLNRRLWDLNTVAKAMKLDENARYALDDDEFYQ